MNKLVFLFFILILTSVAKADRGGGRGITSPRAGAGGGGLSPQEKQDAKEKSRWTMADWLDTKKVIANQNMWLAGNRAKPVEHEFYVAYDTAVVQKEVITAGTPAQTKPSITRAQFGAFTSFVGLSGEYFDYSDNMYGWNAQFNLRVFGNSIQNTNFTIIYGGRTRLDNSTATTETFRNQFYGASFAIYISKQFGVEGLYRQIMDEKSDQNNSLAGTNIEGSVFVDYGIVRIIGTWFSEKLEFTDPSQVVTNKNSTGVYAGGKIYF